MSEESSDDVFVKKKQPDNENEAENNEQDDDYETLKLEEVLKKAKKRDAQLVTDVDLLKRFWGNDN